MVKDYLSGADWQARPFDVTDGKRCLSWRWRRVSNRRKLPAMISPLTLVRDDPGTETPTAALREQATP